MSKKKSKSIINGRQTDGRDGGGHWASLSIWADICSLRKALSVLCYVCSFEGFQAKEDCVWCTERSRTPKVHCLQVKSLTPPVVAVKSHPKFELRFILLIFGWSSPTLSGIWISFHCHWEFSHSFLVSSGAGHDLLNSGLWLLTSPGFPVIKAAALSPCWL